MSCMSVMYSWSAYGHYPFLRESRNGICAFLCCCRQLLYSLERQLGFCRRPSGHITSIWPELADVAFGIPLPLLLCRHRTGGQLSHSAEMVLTDFFCLSRSGCSFSVYLLILQGRFGFLYWKYEKVLNLKLKNGDKWFMKKMLKK